MSDFEERLKELQGHWDENVDKAPGIPEGLYTFQLQHTELRKAETSGNVYINREHLVIDGEYEGEVVWDMIHLATEWGPRQVRTFVEQMGFQSPADLAEDLPGILEAISENNPVYTGKAIKNGDFTNVRIQEIIQTETEGTGETEAGEVQEVESEATESDVADDSWKMGDKVEYDDTDDNGESIVVSGQITGFSEDMSEAHVQSDVGIFAVDVNGLREGSEETAPDVDEIQEQLFALATAHQLGDEVSDDDDRDSLIGKLKEFEWKETELVPDEIELLKSVDIPVIGKAPAKKKTAPPKKKAAAKKVAAKAAPKKAAPKKTAAKKKAPPKKKK